MKSPPPRMCSVQCAEIFPRRENQFHRAVYLPLVAMIDRVAQIER